MPANPTRSPQRAAPSSPSGLPPDPDEEATSSQEAAPSAPQVGTTGGIVPQQGGEWWHAQTQPIQWHDDPVQRRQQAMAETDRRLSEHFQTLDPFAPSGWQATPDAKMYQYGLAQANQEYQQQATQARQQARASLNAENSKTLADYEGRGVQHYIDPASGKVVPIQDEQGRTLYHPTEWEQGVHPKTGQPVLQKRDKYGQRQFKDMPVVPGLDPTDDQLYYKNPVTGETTAAGAITDMANSPNYNVAKVALAANKRRLQAVHQQALEPMKEFLDSANEQFSAAKDQQASLTQQLKAVSDLRDQQDPGSSQYAGYDASVQQLQKQLGDVSAALKPDGQLASTAGKAKRAYAVAKGRASAELYQSQLGEIAARLKHEGKDPNTDPTYQSNLQGLQAVQRGMGNLQPEGGAAASPEAAATTEAPADPLQQSEPATLMKQGQKAVGGVSLQQLAQRFGSGEGPVKPSSLLALRQRVNEIDDTLNARTTPQSAAAAAIQNAPGSVRDVTQISGKLRTSLQAQRDYLDQLYAQRLARLDPDQQDAVKKAIDEQTTSAGGAFGRGAVSAAPGAAGAIAGGKIGEIAGGLTGPYAPIAKPVLGLVGALVGSVLADKGARKVAEKVAPDTYAKFQDYSAKDWEQHALATTGGQAAANLAAFKVSSPSQAVRALGALEKLAKGQALSDAEKQAAQALAVQAGLAGGTAVATPLVEGKKVDPMEALAAAAQMMIFGESRVGGHGAAPDRTAAEAAFQKAQAEGATTPTPSQTAADAARETGADRVPRSAEDVASIFERNPETLPPQPAKSAAESAKSMQDAEAELRQRAENGGLTPEQKAQFESLLKESEPHPPDELAAVAKAHGEAGAEQAGAAMSGATPEELAARRQAQDAVGGAPGGNAIPTSNESTVPKPSPDESPRATAEVPARESQQPSPDVPAGEAVAEKAAGRPPVVEQTPEAAARDKAQYDMLQKRMSTLLKNGGSDAVGSDAYQAAWQKSEDIKNRHGGMPPGTVAAEGEPSESISTQPKSEETPNATNERAQPSNDQPQHSGAAQRPPVQENVAESRGKNRPEAGGGNRPERSPKGQAEGAGAVREAPVATAELRKNNADIGQKPVSSLTPEEAAAELTAAGIKKTPKGVAVEDANSAQLKDAVGKLRRGELTSEGAKPSTTEPRQSDKIIAALKAAKIHKPGELAAATPLSLAHDAALDLAILGIKAGRAVADVVKIAVQRLKARFPDATDEDVARLTDAIHEAHGTPPPDDKGPGPLRKLADKVLPKRADPELADSFAAKRDSGDNIAGMRASETRTELTDAIHRIEPETKAQKLARFMNVPGRGRTNFDTAENALRHYIEAEGSVPKLEAMRQKIESSEKANRIPKDKAIALEALDYAIKNGDKLKDAASRLRASTKAQLVEEAAAGLPAVENKNYVPRYQDVDEQAILEGRGSGSGGGLESSKNRTYETLADSIANGVKPKSHSTIDSMTNRINAGMKAVGVKRFYSTLKNAALPGGDNLVVEPKKVERPQGEDPYYQAPKGYEVVDFAGKKMAIKKEYKDLFTSLTDPSYFSKNPYGRALMKAVAVGKSATLLFDTFHAGRVALTSSAINASHPEGFKVGPRFTEGKMIYDHSPAELTRMATAGEIPKEDLPRLLEGKKITDTLVRNGYNTGVVSDALHQDFMHNLPVLGGVNKAIFDVIQKGAMNEAGIMEFKRQKEQNPSMTDEQVARKVAKELNTKFGNLGRQGWFKSATGRDLARLLALAPQWNEGLVKSEFGGAKQLAKGAVNVAQGKSANIGALGRSLATMAVGTFVANQIINQVTRGKFTWENPEEGWESKVSAWIPDKIGNGPGFFFNPVGVTAEISHLLAKGYERGQGGPLAKSFAAVRDTARSRESTLAKPIDTWVTGRDALGRQIKPDDLPKSVASAALPLPISGGAAYRVAKGLATGGQTEKYPGEFQRQGMQSFGVRTDLAPSPERRVQALAHEYGLAHGKQEHPPGEPSEYVELTDALRRGNDDDVKSAIETLSGKHSAEEMEKYFHRWQNPIFTGSHKNEIGFLSSLNSEQRQQYAKARAERRHLGALALKAISAIPTGKRGGPYAPAP